ncbi:MAG: PaaI family thioesterase [Deferrisomatales bacterium]
MADRAIQDLYEGPASHCYGCGTRNEQGLHIRSYWDGVRAVACFHPRPYHTGIPGYAYGGLIASVVDCHGTATAAAAAHQAAGGTFDTGPLPRFVTAALQVDYLQPVPVDRPMEIRGEVQERTPRKVVVGVSVLSGGELCARGRVVAVRMPERWVSPSPGRAR